jgi:hypothetical protein
MLYASVPHGLPSEDSAPFTIRYQIAVCIGLNWGFARRSVARPLSVDDRLMTSSGAQRALAKNLPCSKVFEALWT